MLLAQALFIAALLALPLRGQWRWLGLLAAALSLIPLQEGVSVAMMARGLWGDFSITSLQLLALSLAVPLFPQAGPDPGAAPAAALGWRGPALVAVIGALFYPLALGLGDFDPYRLGYAGWPLLLPCAVLALLAWRRGHALWLWLLAIDLLAYAAGLPESPNLWDTLLDPLLAVAMLIVALCNGWRAYQTRS